MKYSLFILLLLPFSTLATSTSCSYARPATTGCASEYVYKLTSLNCFNRVGQPGCSTDDWSQCQKEHDEYPILLNQYNLCMQERESNVFGTPFPTPSILPSASPEPTITPLETRLLQKINDCKSLVRNGLYDFDTNKCGCVGGEKIYKVTNDIYDYICVPDSSTISPLPTRSSAPKSIVTKIQPPNTNESVLTSKAIEIKPSLSTLPRPSIYAKVETVSNKGLIAQFFDFFLKLFR